MLFDSIDCTIIRWVFQEVSVVLIDEGLGKEEDKDYQTHLVLELSERELVENVIDRKLVGYTEVRAWKGRLMGYDFVSFSMLLRARSEFYLFLVEGSVGARDNWIEFETKITPIIIAVPHYSFQSKYY